MHAQNEAVVVAAEIIALAQEDVPAEGKAISAGSGKQDAEKNEEDKMINIANCEALAVAIHSMEQLQKIEAIVSDCLSPYEGEMMEYKEKEG